MHALAAFWKFMLVQTQPRSALSSQFSLVNHVTKALTGRNSLRRASSGGGSSCRAVDDASIDADLGVGREGRCGDDGEGGDFGEHVRMSYRRRAADECDVGILQP